MNRLRKRAEISHLSSRMPFASGRALSSLLTSLSPADLQTGRAPDAVRNSIRAERDALAKTATPFGPLHQTITANTKGGPLPIEVQHPLAMLHYLSARSTSVANLMSRAAAAAPPTHDRPWRLVLYCDEVLPGNALAHKTQRKSWHWYWSILEWGAAALSDEVAGHTASILTNL